MKGCLQRAVVGLVVVVAAGCSDGIEACDKVSASDPLITVAEVRDAVTGAGLPQVTIRDFSIANQQLPSIRMLVDVSFPVHGVTVAGDALECAVACGFGRTEGKYQMTFRRAGYHDLIVGADVKYSKFERGCPVKFSHGTVLKVALVPL